jgi:hypothetical protein
VRVLTTLTGPNGELWLAACTSRGEIRTWDTVTGTLVTVARVRGVTALATVGLPDRRYLAAGSSDGSVHVWDPIDAQVQLKIPLNIAVTALTALGADLAVGTAQGVVVLSPEWDMLASRGIQERAGREGLWPTPLPTWDVGGRRAPFEDRCAGSLRGGDGHPCPLRRAAATCGPRLVRGPSPS